MSSQVTLVAATPAILAVPVGPGNGQNTMASVELRTALADLYVGYSLGDASPSTGFLVKASDTLHLTLKPFEVVYGYSPTGGVVFVLRHVSDHARNS